MIQRMSKLASAFCLTAALLATSPPVFAQAPTKSAKPAAKQAPAVRDLQFIDRDSYKALLEKYRGKALLVNFWATWCEPCREEYPMLNQLAKQYAPQGLHVVGISLDGDGEMILVRRFLAKHQPIFPNYRKRAGKEEEFINAVNPRWSGAIPASFFYAADGRQIGSFVGEASREKYEAAIRMLLEKSKSSSPDSR
jgi:thiol-disulfide isomerase/thioredoxin